MTDTDITKLTPEERKKYLDRAKARQIKNEIMDFGVTNAQVRELILQLAYELEKREEMLAIMEALSESEAETETKIFV